MIPTIPYIEAKFDEFNKLMFGGELKRIPIVLGSATRVVGAFSCKVRRNFWGKKEYFDLKLRFSKKFDLPENELEDVIIHEMIHYYIHFKNLKDKRKTASYSEAAPSVATNSHLAWWGL